MASHLVVMLWKETGNSAWLPLKLSWDRALQVGGFHFEDGLEIGIHQ